MDRFLVGVLVFIAALIGVLIVGMHYDQENCVDKCTTAGIQPSRAKCEWVCAYGRHMHRERE